MRGRRAFFSNPKWQTVLGAVFFLILYLLLFGRQGEARDVVIGDRFAYVAMGEYGGARMYELKPGDPQAALHGDFPEIGKLDTPGSTRQLALAKDYLFVADGEEGLRVLDFSNPEKPRQVGAFSELGNVLDVAVDLPYVYVAAGTAGLYVLDASRFPAEPITVRGVLNTPGLAQGVAVVTAAANLTLIAQTGEILERLVVVADGAQGVLVANVQDPARPVQVSRFDLLAERGLICNALKLAVSGENVFVACGEAGLLGLNVSDPTRPRFLEVEDTAGVAQNVAVRNDLIYIADGRAGFRTVRFNPAGAEPEILLTANFYTPPGEVSAVVPVTFGEVTYVCAAVVDYGLFMYQEIMQGNLSSFMPVGFAETPGEASLGQIFGPRHELRFFREKITLTIGRTLVDGILMLGFWVLFLTVLSQFALPVRELKERRLVIDRMLLHFFRLHGEAVHLEDGKVVESIKGRRQKGPGLVRLDTASAAITRDGQEERRIAGPGIAFTQAGEKLETAIDLHRLEKRLGPLVDEDPFAPKQAGESSLEYQERQRRRMETRALTRDRVELVSNIGVFFRLNSQPGTGNTAFGFNPESVRRAVLATVDSSEPRQSWEWLPAYLAVDIWREYLRQYDFAELFALGGPMPGEPPEMGRHSNFDHLCQLMNTRLKQPGYVERGLPVSGLIDSQEFAVLQERGLRVESAFIEHVRCQPEDGQRLIQNWSASWKSQADQEKLEVDQLEVYMQQLGKQDAIVDFALAAVRLPALDAVQGSSGSVAAPDLQVVLNAYLRGTVGVCRTESQAHQNLSSFMVPLEALIRMVRGS